MGVEGKRWMMVGVSEDGSEGVAKRKGRKGGQRSREEGKRSWVVKEGRESCCHTC
ncbi:hypothetical protein E2C01_089058 [Portunus trituberculatus]|uniref:Uncharacterized protein n=1 Tax=Portunus trituberculatus TaxID=210409 RepID=A0A5B7J7U2_PORTR|nr:hypothetical protein [Portunus trituberculatus]